MIEKSDVSGGEGVKSEVEEEVKGEEIGALRKLLKTLGQMEEFYDCIGGIIGYQIAMLELLAQSTYEGHTINWSKHLMNPWNANPWKFIVPVFLTFLKTQNMHLKQRYGESRVYQI